MQLAWNAAGRVLDTRGGRLMRITLLLAKRTYHVISVYAPTFRASESEKEQCYKDLHNMTALCKSGEELILLGGFNARVGIREPRIDAADGDTETLLGSFGLPEINDNGRFLLDFCRQQGSRPFRVMSTFFQHKTYGTWQHNLTEQRNGIRSIMLLLNPRHVLSLKMLELCRVWILIVTIGSLVSISGF